MKKIIYLLTALLVSGILTGATHTKKKTKMLTTLDGYPYKIITKSVEEFIAPTSFQHRPYIFVKSAGQERDVFFSSNGLYEVFFTVETEKPIIPMYFSMMFYRLADNFLIYNFSTPFLVEMGNIPQIPPFRIYGSSNYTGYAQKIAPYAQRVVYELKPSNRKQFIGDINLQYIDIFPFVKEDFLQNKPTYLFPTDGQKWYLNYRQFDLGAGTADYNTSGTLDYSVPVLGGTHVLQATITYAELQ